MQHPVVAAKLAQLRDVATGTRAFRQLVEELGTLLAYEASRDLAQRRVVVQTPLATTTGLAIAPRIGLAPVLRAGTSMLQGALHLFPDAQVWHLGVYRDEHRLVPVEYYNRLPAEPSVDVCFILDPMLATGGSAVAAPCPVPAARLSRTDWLITPNSACVSASRKRLPIHRKM